MANGELNNINESAENIKIVFAEISNLVDELNKNLTTTVELTNQVSNTQAQSGDNTKKALDKEAMRAKVVANIGKLSDKERKALVEQFKTGKGLTKEAANKLGLEVKRGGTAAAARARSLNLTKAEMTLNTEQLKVYNKILDTVIKIAYGALDVMITQLMAAEKEVNKISKELNISKSEALGVKRQFAQIALDSNDIRLNSVRVTKANAALNKQLGTATIFSGELLGTFSKLTEIVGISAEAAGSLAFQAQRSGKSFREVQEDALAVSYDLQRSEGTSFYLKDILEETGKVTGQVRANLGANPTAIAEAVTKAKLFGAELNDIVASSKSLLDFESSIEAELEAELLTGKQLNLERARAAALAGDQATLADELRKNAGSFADFTKMNVLQQEALAKAVGMQADQLADVLFKQETQGMNTEELRAMGKGELADRMEQLDLQERIALSQEKFALLMGDVATAVLPIVEAFGAVFEFLAGTKEVLVPLVGVMTALATAAGLFAAKAAIGATRSIITAAAKTFGSFAGIPLGLGIPAGIAAVAMLYTLMRKSPKAKDAISDSSRGPFTIMDNYGALGTTTPGDNLMVSPNRGNSSAPIVVQSSVHFDSFAASNGNGRRGLGGTQESQPSMQFV